jgi:hypothetical protein
MTRLGANIGVLKASMRKVGITTFTFASRPAARSLR